MILGTVTKEPAEIFPVSMSFSDRLSTGDSLTSGTVSAVNHFTGASASDILFGSATISGSALQQTIQAGVDATNYLLEFRVTTAAGFVLEDEIVLAVREDYQT